MTEVRTRRGVGHGSVGGLPEQLDSLFEFSVGRKHAAVQLALAAQMLGDLTTKGSDGLVQACR